MMLLLKMPSVKISFLIFLCLACARSPLKERAQAMRLTQTPKEIQDDLTAESLLVGVEDNIRYFQSSEKTEITFGPKVVSKDYYLQTLESLKQDLNSGIEVKSALVKNFDFYEVYGDKEWGQVFITSYYYPIIKGSRVKTEEFSQALYARPADMVLVDLEAFVQTFPQLSKALNAVGEQKSKDKILRGRLVHKSDGEIDRILPYFNRAEIDTKNSLNDQQLEIVWVDPIDSFSLQIQGSGTVELADGQMVHVAYDSQNGHPYFAIGKALREKIQGDLNWPSIEQYLRSLSRDELMETLNANASYVFFRVIPEPKGQTFAGSSLVDGRTIATDQRFFPKGTLAYLEFEKPLFNGEEMLPQQWQKTARVVLDQDTGGAIRGGHRLDLFWGKGVEGKRGAGVIKGNGRLYYLVPKTTGP